MTEYIKREDALKICSGEIQNIRYMEDAFGKRFECVVGARRINADEIAEQIKKIPSADVRPVVRGRDIYNTVNGHCEFKCSVCGVELSSVYGGDNDFGLDGGYFNFCPNCGADMREEDE